MHHQRRRLRLLAHHQRGLQAAERSRGRVVGVPLNLDGVFEDGLLVCVSLAPDFGNGGARNGGGGAAAEPLRDRDVALDLCLELLGQTILGPAAQDGFDERGCQQVRLAGMLDAEREQCAAVVGVRVNGFAPPVQRVVIVVQLDLLARPLDLCCQADVERQGEGVKPRAQVRARGWNRNIYFVRARRCHGSCPCRGALTWPPRSRPRYDRFLEVPPSYDAPRSRP